MLSRFLVITLTSSVFALNSVCQGGVIFDPDGQGALVPSKIQSFDFLPGNALMQGAISTPGSFMQYYQARLGAAMDEDGNIVTIPGLNETGGFQITIIAGYAASGTWNQGLFAASQSGGTSFLMIFRNDSLSAHDVSGAGFTDGKLIYSGQVASATSMFAVMPGTGLLDYFGADNYSGQQSLGGGGYYSFFSLESAAGIADANYFPSGLESVALTSSSVLPFRQIDPSAQFSAVDPNGNVTTITPSLGTTNGQSGPDMQTQADGSMALVPEPLTLGLLVLGVPLLARSYRRKTRA